MKILFLEPFFGGSHRDFALGYAESSGHEIVLATLPARFWKWRMRGAALHFFREIESLSPFDAILATDLMGVADFRALFSMRGPVPPIFLYIHENQLTYPLAPGESLDVHFGFTDITSALAADRLAFNSATHRDAFLAALPGFINQMPEFLPTWVPGAVAKKSSVLTPGCRFDPGPLPLAPLPKGPPLVIWNHRWEFDKNPGDFFAALYALADQGLDFHVALLGENFQFVPKPFLDARERLGDRVAAYGHEPSREQYLQWLRQGTVVVSTANQENFGISVVEAVRAGCLPLLPRRLSYPEILPEAFHDGFLYDSQVELTEKLAGILTNPRAFARARQELSEAMEVHSWKLRAPEFDAAMEGMVRDGR
ncbi:MAG: DUF3524 domain-containing protein [Proteobacteria bacterium]|nr:DUF3524 domain-containing protein [Pseudomonadota bacterium]